LLRGIDDGWPVADLVSGEEVAEVVGHELATLISSDNVREKFMGKAKVHAEVNE
jgi:hypothetical protein